MNGFLAELRRRNVIRMAGLYLVGAWVIVQVAETVLPAFDVPSWVLRAIVIVAAIGFVPALVFAWVFELTPDGLKRDGEVPQGHSMTPTTGRRMDRMIIAGLLTLITLMVLDRFWPAEKPGSEKPGSESISATAASRSIDRPRAEIDSDPGFSDPGSINPKSIAVLAFADLSPGGDQEYFSDGMAEEILNALAKVKDLHVAGRTSSFHFKGRNEDLRAIGETLGVAHILEGSVRKQGNRVRITAQLIRASNGFHLWSETYDGDLDDVFELQERIARTITDELKVVLQGGQGSRLVNAGTTDTEAYALYLQATAIFNRREGARFAEALAQIDKAIELDPGFARAWSRKATLLSVSANYQARDSGAKMRAAEQAARRAIELDPVLAEPHAALAMNFVDHRRYREYRREIERAIAIDPDDVTVNFWGGVALLNMGYREQAKVAFDRALVIDPLLPNALMWRARLHMADGEMDIAQRQLQRAADAGHGFIGIATSWVSLRAGDRVKAAAQMAEGMQAYFLHEFPAGAGDAFARASMGDAAAKPEALRYIDEYLASEPEVVAGIVPYVLMRSGEIQRGFDLVRERPTSNESMALSEIFSGLQQDTLHAPGFAGFVRGLGLAAYWDEFGPPDNCRKAGNGDYTCQ